MKKIIFGIFAHPDDEAFGPSGTLLMEAKTGNDVHLITLTLGEAGANPDNAPDLATVREQEWRKAGQLIGTRSMRFLGYKDGQLSNATMVEIYKKLLSYIDATIKDAPSDSEIELMSMDTNGISGHIDHIVASRSACYVFYELKKQDVRVKRLRLASVPRSQLPEPDTHWLYMDAGRNDSEIDEVIDAREYRDEIITIMKAHRSQRHDYENHLENLGDQLGLNYFIVKS